MPTSPDLRQGEPRWPAMVALLAVSFAHVAPFMFHVSSRYGFQVREMLEAHITNSQLEALLKTEKLPLLADIFSYLPRREPILESLLAVS